MPKIKDIQGVLVEEMEKQYDYGHTEEGDYDAYKPLTDEDRGWNACRTKQGEKMVGLDKDRLRKFFEDYFGLEYHAKKIKEIKAWQKKINCCPYGTGLKYHQSGYEFAKEASEKYAQAIIDAESELIVGKE